MKKIFLLIANSLDDLSKLCFSTKAGVSLHGISDAARALGLETICGKVDLDELKATSLPCILH